jgi:hypothetical protein
MHGTFISKNFTVTNYTSLQSKITTHKLRQFTLHHYTSHHFSEHCDVLLSFHCFALICLSFFCRAQTKLLLLLPSSSLALRPRGLSSPVRNCYRILTSFNDELSASNGIPSLSYSTPSRESWSLRAAIFNGFRILFINSVDNLLRNF